MAEGTKDQGTLSDAETSSSEPTRPIDVGGGDLPGVAQATQAELDAAEEKARTTYVLLMLYPDIAVHEDEADEDYADVWRVLGKIAAASRAAAWEEAKRRYPQVKPEVGEETCCQLVPKRFWQQVTARAKPPTEPELEVEGL